MASNSIGNLNVQLNLEIGRLQAQIDAANGKIRGLTRKMEGDFSKAAKNINKALGSLGVGLSVGALTAFGKSVVNLGGEITDLASQAGLSTDAFQTFSNVAKESGVDAQQVANAFVQMRKNIEDAADGSGAAADALANLGLSAKNLQELSPERQFEEIAKSISTATDKNAAFNAGLEILGAKNAPKLTEVLKRLGTEGFDALAKSTANLRLTPEQLKTLDDAGDKLDRIWTTLKVITAKVFVVTVDVVSNPISSVKAPDGKTNVNPFDSGFSPGELPSFPTSQSAGLKGANVPYNDAGLAAVKADQAAAALKKQAEFAEDYKAALAGMADAQARLDAEGLVLLEDQRANREELNRLISEGAAVTESVRTPLEAYNAELSRLVELQRAGVITADTYDAAVSKAGESYQKAQVNAAAYTGTLEDLEEPLSRFEQVNSQMWENIADRTGAALSDMLLDGEAKFKDFGAAVARMIADVALRLAIINPIMNTVFGLSGANTLPSLFGARASGGPMSAGGSYLVGEDGPEVVTPSVNSHVTPNHALTAIGGGGGTNVFIDATGADVAAVARLQAAFSQFNTTFDSRAVGAVANERRRGGGSGRSLGS